MRLILTTALLLATAQYSWAATDTYVKTEAPDATTCTKNGGRYKCGAFAAVTAGGSCNVQPNPHYKSGAYSVTTCTVTPSDDEAVSAPTPTPFASPISAPTGGAAPPPGAVSKSGTYDDDNNPATPRPPASENWAATKYNSKEILQAELEKESAPNQKDAYTLQSNIMYGCVDKSLNGRTDSACASTPDHPECTGLSKSLGNATVCVEMFEPASLGCKVYGKGGYAMEDWIGFGGQYYDSLKSCASSKTESDKLIPTLVSAEQLEMVNFKANGPLGSGVEIFKSEPKSNLTQTSSSTTEEGTTLAVQDLEKLIESNPDGASALGYEEGEIIRRAVKGEAYVKVILDSPFAEKLSEPLRARAETAANDPLEATKTALAKNGLESGDPLPTATAASSTSPYSPNSVSATNPSLPAYTQNLQQSNPDFDAPYYNLDSPSKEMEQDLKKLTANEPSNPKTPLLSDRIAQLERMAKNSSPSLRGRSLASIQEPQESPPMVEDATLFNRVSVAYRKRQLGLRSQESITGKAVRSMDQPAFFKEL